MSSEIVLKEKASHWYRWDAANNRVVAWYEVPNKSKPGEMRPTTKRDAKKMPGSMVSVSSIIDVKNKPDIVKYKVRQALMAAITLTRLPDEKDKDYIDRIVEDMEAESTKAKAKGAAVHDVVEKYLASIRGGEFHSLDQSSEAFKLALPAMDWIDQNVEKIHGVEMVVGNPMLGYAGRLDLHCNLKGVGPAVVDFKTQKEYLDPKGNWKPAFYWEYGVQLAAYAAALNAGARFGDVTSRALVSVVINSTNPAPVAVKVWEDPEKRLVMFLNLLAIWKDDENFYPNAA